MQLHVGTDKLAYAGVMSAIAVICIILSGVIESSSLFFILLGAYVTGLIRSRVKLSISCAATAAIIVLGLLLAPKKLHVLTYAFCAVYILTAESIYCMRDSGKTVSAKKEWLIKAAVYTLIYAAGTVTVAVLGPALFFSFRLPDIPAVPIILAGYIICGVFVFIADRIYVIFAQWITRKINHN